LHDIPFAAPPPAPAAAAAAGVGGVGVPASPRVRSMAAGARRQGEPRRRRNGWIGANWNEMAALRCAGAEAAERRGEKRGALLPTPLGFTVYAAAPNRIVPIFRWGVCGAAECVSLIMYSSEEQGREGDVKSLA